MSELPERPMRKGDVAAIEVEWLTVALSGIAGKEGHVYRRTSWHVVKAHGCTREGRLRDAVDAGGAHFKMCERLRSVKRIVPIPADEANTAAIFEASLGLTWSSVEELARWAQPFRLQAENVPVTANAVHEAPYRKVPESGNVKSVSE